MASYRRQTRGKGGFEDGIALARGHLLKPLGGPETVLHPEPPPDCRKMPGERCTQRDKLVVLEALPFAKGVDGARDDRCNRVETAVQTIRLDHAAGFFLRDIEPSQVVDQIEAEDLDGDKLALHIIAKRHRIA